MRERDTLLSVERQTKGRVRDERIHNPTQVPTACQNIWFAFWELNRTRQSNGFGMSPLQFSELKAWCDLMGERLDRWEIGVFARLDNVYLTEVSAKTEAAA